MPVVPVTSESLDRAAALLRTGGVVAFPTETVYGLGADAFDARAVARIFEIKRRPEFDPLIVHVLDEAMLHQVVSDVPKAARALAERYWPGPLTIVLDKRPAVPDLVTAGLPTVAVRMPAHHVTRALLERVGIPLAAPSANPFGYVSPTRAEHVVRMLGETVDLVLDGGPTEHGIESTIVGFVPEAVLLRPGAIAREAIEAVVGPIATRVSDERTPLGPGRLPQHYAPHTPVRLVDPAQVAPEERAAAAAIVLAKPVDGYAALWVLSPRGDLHEAAAHLFEALHQLDALGLERIDVQPVPEKGLGVAIMDRLRRASAQF